MKRYYRCPKCGKPVNRSVQTNHDRYSCGDMAITKDLMKRINKEKEHPYVPRHRV